MQENIYNIKEVIKTFILEEFLPKGYFLDDDTDLFDSGIIDSLGVIKLTAFIEESFRIVINPSEVRFENFNSVNKIVEIISKKIKNEG